MYSISGIILLITIIILRLLPEALTLFLASEIMEKKEKTEFSGKRYPVFKGILFVVFTFGIQFALYFFLHFWLKGYPNFFYTMKKVAGMEITYQDGGYFATSWLVTIAAALILGMMARKGRALGQVKQNLLLCFFALAAMISLGGYSLEHSGRSRIVINEVCGNNTNIYLFPTDNYGDYIELYHTGFLACELDDLYLSDDSLELMKLPVGEGTLKPGEYLLICLDKDTSPFGINQKGEVIYLSDSYGKILDQVNVPKQEEDAAYSRMEDGGSEWRLVSATPGESNGTAQSLEVIDSPVFSHAGGFYDEEFFLELSVPEGTKIYYTLDGSIPDAEDREYTEPLLVYDKSSEPNVANSVQNVVLNWESYQPDLTPVDKAFVVRAVAIDTAGNSSEVVTKTYFIDQEKYADRTIVSLVADPEDLFGDQGIYVTGKEYDDWYLSGGEGEEPEANFRGSGRGAERPASLEIFFEEGDLNQAVGIRIQGAGTRRWAKKRFSVYARKEYSGSKWFDLPLMEAGRNTHSIVLRDGFANAFSPYLVTDRAVFTQESFPATVFLNGEYWCDTYVQEKFSESYFEEKYGFADDNTILVKNGDGETERANELYEELVSFVAEEDFSQEEDYRIFCDMIDLQSFIDYSCINLYLMNLDYDETKNYLMVRSDETGEGSFEDGKWRWLIYDMDDVEYQEIDEQTGENLWVTGDSFSRQGGGVTYAFNEGPIYRNLKKNPDFCRQFVLTFMDLVNYNFSEAQVEKVLKSWGEDLTWNDSFFLKRADYIVPCLAKEFGLTGTLETLDLRVNIVEGGRVRVNTITPDLSSGQWSGEYYTDYPVTVTAAPEEGYRFVGWSGETDSREAEITVSVKEGGIVLNAHFEKIQ
ncbi:MAG: CotH kinase family protein [Lachnospiraceae bacterium]|nr:CotH kinase family protein [Lachnospiraceae bacterium]